MHMFMCTHTSTYASTHTHRHVLSLSLSQLTPLHFCSRKSNSGLIRECMVLSLWEKEIKWGPADHYPMHLFFHKSILWSSFTSEKTNGRSEHLFRTYIVIDQWIVATEKQKENPRDFLVITLLKLIFYLWDSLWTFYF